MASAPFEPAAGAVPRTAVGAACLMAAEGSSGGSARALANAPARAPMVSPDRRMIGFLQKVKANGAGFGTTSLDSIPASLSRVGRDQFFASALAASCSPKAYGCGFKRQ
jgi:hypothetical protein